MEYLLPFYSRKYLFLNHFPKNEENPDLKIFITYFWTLISCIKSF